MNALISSVEEVTMLFEGAFQALGGNSSLGGIPAFKETMSREGKVFWASVEACEPT